MKKAWVSCAALLAAAVATAHGDPTINGCRDTGYQQLWVQSDPTTFGNNQPGFTVCPPPGLGTGVSVSLNNSNTVGVGPCGSHISDPGAVSTGAEYKIPFSALGNPSAMELRIAGFVNGGGHDFVSNQIIGQIVGSPDVCSNPGEPRNVDLSDVVRFPGNQFVQVANSSDVVAAMDAPAIDGTLESSFYGSALYVTPDPIGTSFGDSTNGSGGGGSEIDAVYARVATVDGVKSLYIFVAGNLETNFNKYDLFIDTGTIDGQNRLRSDNADVDFNGLNRMGSTAEGNGLKFDADFTADWWIAITNGGGPLTMYVNYAQLLTDGAGPGLYLGSTELPGTFTRTEEPCTPEPLPIPGPDIANGSELNNFSAARCGDFLHLFFGGNLATDGTKFDIFLDVGEVDGDVGQSQLRGDNVVIDNGALNRMGDDLGTTEVTEGLKFDDGFSANYWLGVKTFGVNNNSDAELIAFSAQLRTNGAEGEVDAPGLLDYAGLVVGLKSDPMFNPLGFNGQYCVRSNDMNECVANHIGSAFNPTSLVGLDIQGDLPFGGDVNGLTMIGEIRTSYAPRLLGSGNIFDPLGTQMGNPNVAFPGLIVLALDNSNVDGVSDTTASMAAAQAVATGVEVKISLAELGWKGGPIKICAFINGQNSDFVSNQVLGASVGTSSLGDPRSIDFTTIAGNQYIEIADVTMLPCPTASPCPEPVAPCPGDFNDDGVIDLLDLLGFNSVWSGSLGLAVPPGNAAADYNNDLVIDLLDLLAFNSDWSGNLGQTCP